MLEDSSMDKKSLNRSVPQSRPAALDSKKESTQSTHKPWPNKNKKREGSANVPKNDPFRKNVPPQRGRGQMDKRPRTCSASSSTMGGAQNTRIEEDIEPEIGSVFMPGSKKQNLNHLLNFTYPSRGGTDRRSTVVVHRWWVPHKHEPDLYLRAYCQFVVKEEGVNKVNLMDPDLALHHKWEQIEEIVVRSTGRSECPICLGAPVAGRVGLCGHVYCWACVLHYAAVHMIQPPPCPVCTAPLHVDYMKPTRMVQWESPPEEATMRLVRRLRGQKSHIVEVAPPRGHLKEFNQNILPLEELQRAPFAKLFLATKQQEMDIIERDRNQIREQINAEIDTTEIKYLEQALGMLKLKENMIQMQYRKPTKTSANKVDKAPTVREKQVVTNNAKLDWFDVCDEGASCSNVVDKIMTLDIQSDLNPNVQEFECNVIDDLNTSEEFSLVDSAEEAAYADIDKQNQEKYFYFYQAEDGQQVFLNKVNIGLLTASWGALASAPNVIRGKVLHRETFLLTEETRKRLPFTAHLPLYCSFDIVELDLNLPFVTDAALANFAAELEKRARLRAKQECAERRLQQARHAAEEPATPDLSSPQQFPPARSAQDSPPLPEVSSPSNFEPLSPSTSSTASMEQNSGTSPTASVTVPTRVSFAKVVGTSGTWRERKTTASPPSPRADDQVNKRSALSVAVDMAIEAKNSTAKNPGKKKNKKSKQKVIFSTGMHRAA